MAEDIATLAGELTDPFACWRPNASSWTPAS
jgi:hypothetical protein